MLQADKPAPRKLSKVTIIPSQPNENPGQVCFNCTADSLILSLFCTCWRARSGCFLMFLFYYRHSTVYEGSIEIIREQITKSCVCSVLLDWYYQTGIWSGMLYGRMTHVFVGAWELFSAVAAQCGTAGVLLLDFYRLHTIDT